MLKKLRLVDENALTEIKKSELVSVTSETITSYLTNRTGGDFAGHAFYLDSCYDWVLGLDSDGCTILVPTKKD